MALESGFILLHRKMTKWEWYDDINTKVLFLHLLLTVNYEPAKWRGMTIDRGQRIVSLSKLAKEVGLSVKSLRTSLNKLKSTNEVASESTSQYTLITVINYSKYQDWENFAANERASERANEGQTKGKRGANEGQQRNKEEIRTNKAISIITPLTPLDTELSERSFSSDAEGKLKEWIRYKTEKRQPYKPTGLKSFCSVVERKIAEHGEYAVLALVDESMAANWQGIPWDKLSKAQVGKKQSSNPFL